MEKVKIILDADVLIHFAKAERLNMLPEILPEYEHVVLSTVYTIGFLYYGIKRGKMSLEECEQFVKDVVAKGSKLPTVDFEKYLPNNQV